MVYGEARLASANAFDAKLLATAASDSALLSAMADCIGILDLDGRLIDVNGRGLTCLGAAHATVLLGCNWDRFWQAPDSLEAGAAAVGAARAGRASRFQGALEADPAIWWDVVVTPILGEDGQPERILTAAREITDLKQAEIRQGLLMQEMAHRVKNTLAIVQAVAAQTLRNAESLDAAGEALGARLLALAQAHDVLMQGAWTSADLRGLVDGAVALHGDGEPGRFVIAGPDVTLGPKPAMTLALMLHELGTNAAKYGALSRAEGHVAISWAIDAEADRLRFRWEEVDGPPVAPPTRTGFGSRLIERSLVHSFGGTARLSYPVTGVVLTMEAPLASVVVEAAG